jgi:hypothetical protein
MVAHCSSKRNMCEMLEVRTQQQKQAQRKCVLVNSRKVHMAPAACATIVESYQMPVASIAGQEGQVPQNKY